MITHFDIYFMTISKQMGCHFADNIVEFFWLAKTVTFWLKLYWSLFERVQFTIHKHWLTQWLGAIEHASLRWRHNGCDSVSNHQPHDCLLNLLSRRRSKKTSKLRVTGLCAWNSPGTGEFPAQMACNAENVSIWWRHYVSFTFGPLSSTDCGGRGPFYY